MTGKYIMNPPGQTEAFSRLKSDFDAIDSIFCKTGKYVNVLKHHVDYIAIA